MGTAMKQVEPRAEVKSFNSPYEVRTFEKGRLDLINVGGSIIGRATLQPGWKWSTCVKPISKTSLCEASHLQYHVSGTLDVLMDNGSIYRCHAGDVSMLPAGHDAWVVGNEPVVVIDFEGMLDYARSMASLVK